MGYQTLSSLPEYLTIVNCYEDEPKDILCVLKRKYVSQSQKTKNPFIALSCYEYRRHWNIHCKMVTHKCLDCIREIYSRDLILFFHEMIWLTILSKLWNDKVLYHEVLLSIVNFCNIMIYWPDLYCLALPWEELPFLFSCQNYPHIFIFLNHKNSGCWKYVYMPFREASILNMTNFESFRQRSFDERGN